MDIGVSCTPSNKNKECNSTPSTGGLSLFVPLSDDSECETGVGLTTNQIDELMKKVQPIVDEHRAKQLKRDVIRGY